jgi:SAM-dependent MidA family methyltransferase
LGECFDLCESPGILDIRQQPVTDGREVNRLLENLLRAEAGAASGVLAFDRFMELALYAPGLGYYAAGSVKLGAAGDFTTAPEVSPLFGRCLAAQCREVLTAVPGGDILELGAGSGALAVEILESLAREGPLPGRYLILEPSPDLQARQAEQLAQRSAWAAGRVQWLSRLPQRFRGIVLANEVLDAMPVHRFRIGAGGTPLELLVRPTAEGWEEVVAEPRSSGLTRAVQTLQSRGLAQSPGYTSEVNLRLRPWLGALAASLDQALVLLVDYGYPQADYYRAERSGGTLMCHARHHAHADPYRDIGLQDITAHVDFTAVAEHGAAAGLRLAGYTTQALFLIGCGLDRELAAAAADPAQVMDLALGARTLVLPSAMGERFQVIALEKGVADPWCGFSSRDLRDRLNPD